MLAFICPHPSILEEKDGFTQRVIWIDSLVKDVNRIYFDISFLRNFKISKEEISSNVVFYRVNFLIHFFVIFKLIINVRIVYFHSILNSLKFLPAYFFSKTITDMHGVVPEEMKLMGNKWKYFIFNLVEFFVVKKGWRLIYVTDSMKEHFYIKYRRINDNDFVISILPEKTDRADCAVSRDLSTVIYSGGMQPWQNIDLMLSASSVNKNFKYKFLCPDNEAMYFKAKDYNIFNFEIKSVKNSEVKYEYLNSSLGFILRDDIVVNNVACPTKIVEYMYWGVVPIVLSSKIGDFEKMGFKYIALDKFIKGFEFNIEDYVEMSTINRKIIDSLYQKYDAELISFKKILCSSNLHS